MEVPRVQPDIDQGETLVSIVAPAHIAPEVRRFRDQLLARPAAGAILAYAVGLTDCPTCGGLGRIGDDIDCPRCGR